MSEKSIILLSIDLFIFITLLKLVFGSFKEIKKCFYYLVKPNILSLIEKDYAKDLKYTDKLLLIVFVVVIIGVTEVHFFY